MESENKQDFFDYNNVVKEIMRQMQNSNDVNVSKDKLTVSATVEDRKFKFYIKPVLDFWRKKTGLNISITADNVQVYSVNMINLTDNDIKLICEWVSRCNQEYENNRNMEQITIIEWFTDYFNA